MRRPGIARVSRGSHRSGASRAYCERLFAPDLDSVTPDSNRSQWRTFPLLSNARWSAGNTVLIGDALRTGPPFRSARGRGRRIRRRRIALDRALGEAGDDVPRLLAAFERERRHVVDKLVAAADSKLGNLVRERMADKMALEPVDRSTSDYHDASGTQSDERLAEAAPRFMAAVTCGSWPAHGDADARRARRPSSTPCRTSTGRAQIGFTVPMRYNASGAAVRQPCRACRQGGDPLRERAGHRHRAALWPTAPAAVCNGWASPARDAC